MRSSPVAADWTRADVAIASVAFAVLLAAAILSPRLVPSSRSAAPFAPGSARAIGAPIVTGTRWQDDPIWSDGQAEVSVFQATETKYGIPRPFRYVHVVVAEDLRRDLLVKSDAPDPPGGLLRVLKNNQLYDIPTGTYSYHQMASVFLNVSDLGLVKETLTSHELCGNTFSHLVAPRPEEARLRFFSYFDKEADRSFDLDLTGVQAYDALPVALRAIPFAGGARQRIRLLPSLVSNHGHPPVIGEAEILVVGEEAVTTGLGPIPGWRVEVRTTDGSDTFWFEKAGPQRLLRWEQADGGRYVLENSRRMAYWKLNAPGDETKLLEHDPSSHS